MSTAITFYPWGLKEVFILELIYLIKNSKNGILEFLGYFSPKSLPFKIILLRSGKNPLYISVSKFTKVDSEEIFSTVHPNANYFLLNFDIIKIISNSEELKKIGRDLETN